jgi:hypothetical protein
VSISGYQLPFKFLRQTNEEVIEATVEDAGKATGAALKDGTVTLKRDAASAPANAVRETKTDVSKFWNAVW